MEEGNSYLEKLEEALDKKFNDLETHRVVTLKEGFRKYHQAFKTHYDVLVRKSLIHEDQYKYEQKVSNIEVPPKGPIADSSKTDEMGMRLSAFETQLDFLNNYYQFKTDELSLKQIKLLAGLCQYILWDRMSPGSSNLNTRVLSEISEKVKQGSDSLSAGIIVDAEKQMASSTKDIMIALKDIMFYQKQRYKIELRNRVIAPNRVDENMVRTRREDVVKKIKHAFPTAMQGYPFFPRTG